LGYKLNIENNVKQHLAHIGFTPQYGARALRRTILSHIEEPLSRMIVEDGLKNGNIINISLSEKKIQLSVA
jgi:ATP-dependent Clp protease ATP-binding subunit ClpA